MTSDIERQREHFNSIAERYQQGRADANHLRIKSLIWKEALTCLKPLEGRRIQVLEPMCGYAEGLQILHQNTRLDCDYAGFDYSDVIVDELSRQFTGGKVWQGDVTSYKPETDAYDLVVLIGGLHHVPDFAPHVVRNMASGLKPGGMFVNFEPTHGNRLFQTIRDGIYQKNEIFDEATERAFSVEELKSFFSFAGLEEVRTLYPGLLAYILYYNTYAFPKLNVGGKKMVDFLFSLDRKFINNFIGKALSFATLSVWRRPD